MTYINCPPTVNNLVRFDKTPASPNKLNKEQNEGKCVQNAEPAPPYYEVYRYCDYKGEITYQGECWCKAGYERKNASCSGIAIFGIRYNYIGVRGNFT